MRDRLAYDSLTHVRILYVPVWHSDMLSLFREMREKMAVAPRPENPAKID